MIDWAVNQWPAEINMTTGTRFSDVYMHYSLVRHTQSKAGMFISAWMAHVQHTDTVTSGGCAASWPFSNELLGCYCSSQWLNDWMHRIPVIVNGHEWISKNRSKCHWIYDSTELHNSFHNCSRSSCYTALSLTQYGHWRCQPSFWETFPWWYCPDPSGSRVLTSPCSCLCWELVKRGGKRRRADKNAPLSSVKFQLIPRWRTDCLCTNDRRHQNGTSAQILSSFI